MEVLLMKLVNKSKILTLGFLTMLTFSNTVEGMAWARSWLPSFTTQKAATQEQINTAKSCPICLEDFKENESLTTLNCDENVPHIFHKECLDSSINAGDEKCPICRKTLPMTSRVIKNIIKKYNPVTSENLKVFSIHVATGTAFLCAQKSYCMLMQQPKYFEFNVRNVIHYSSVAFLFSKLAHRLDLSPHQAALLGTIGAGLVIMPFLQMTDNNGQTYTTLAAQWLTRLRS